VGATVLAVSLAGCSSSGNKNAGKVLFVQPNPAGTKLGNENIARFERLVTEGLNQGRLQVMDELLSPTILDHQSYGPGYPPSRGGVKGLTAALRTAFPDLHAEAKTLVATNDGTQTFAIIKTTGTNTGPYLGTPATGHKIALDIEESARWQDGKMVEHWGVADNIGLLTQMGFFPPNSFPSLSPTLLDVKYRQQLDSPRPLIPTAATTVDERLAAVRRAVNVGVNTGDIYVDSEVVSKDYVENEFYGAGFPDGVDRHKMAIAVNRTALPNLHTTIHQLAPIGDGSQVFGIMEGKGTNDGPFLGIPPTGRNIDIGIFEYFHFNKDGKVFEHNGVADLLGLITDLGFVPPGSVPVYTKDKVDPQFRHELDLG
jgi:predicted ester cyclase